MVFSLRGVENGVYKVLNASQDGTGCLLGQSIQGFLHGAGDFLVVAVDDFFVVGCVVTMAREVSGFKNLYGDFCR